MLGHLSQWYQDVSSIVCAINHSLFNRSCIFVSLVGTRDKGILRVCFRVGLFVVFVVVLSGYGCFWTWIFLF